MKPTLVVLAAGMGSRYGGLKQIDPVGPNKESILDYSVYDAIRAGFGKLIFVIRRDIEKVFKENIGYLFEKYIDVEYVFQELDNLPEGFQKPAERAKPWGTGHAILCAKDYVKTPFAVINSDDFYGSESFRIMADYLSKQNEKQKYCMVGFVLQNTLSKFGSVSRGVCSTDNNDNLLNISEYKNIKEDNGKVVGFKDDQQVEFSGQEIVSMNMWGFTLDIFEYLESFFRDFLEKNINKEKSEFYIPFVIDELIKSNEVQVKVLKTNDSWFGITYKEDKKDVIRKINELVEKGVYPEKLF